MINTDQVWIISCLTGFRLFLTSSLPCSHLLRNKFLWSLSFQLNAYILEKMSLVRSTTCRVFFEETIYHSLKRWHTQTKPVLWLATWYQTLTQPPGTGLDYGTHYQRFSPRVQTQDNRTHSCVSFTSCSGWPMQRRPRPSDKGCEKWSQSRGALKLHSL